jgi:hypothetical protein
MEPQISRIITKLKFVDVCLFCKVFLGDGSELFKEYIKITYHEAPSNEDVDLHLRPTCHNNDI